MSIAGLNMRLVSSLEKVLITDALESHPVLERQSVLKGEKLDFQLAVVDNSSEVVWDTRRFSVEVAGLPTECTCREAVSMYADFPCFPIDTAQGTPYYLDSESGSYPDLLQPLDGEKFFRAVPGKTVSLWFTCCPDKAGEYPVTVTLTDAVGEQSSVSFLLTVVDAALPAQPLLFTQWFHCDCLASYYNVPVFSERHWEIIENYMRCAAENGINCILTPVLTPPLDTEVGGERPTVQLVGVTQTADGSYTFDFSLLGRWITLAQQCGIYHFEISHLFSQWGAEFAPKVVAEKDGALCRIFGWDTPGTGEAYGDFLNQMLPALVSFLRHEGVLDHCMFHISDEPSGEHLTGYMKAKSIVAPHLQGCKLVDALSSVDFYKRGAVEVPIPATSHIEPFLNEDIPERWAYYCCGQWKKVSNRFIAYPSFRNRILGVQLYKYNIKGFLQWGYNFWYSQYSRRMINPYVSLSGDRWVPAGDTFSVYPAQDGTPLESVRLNVFREALQDVAALTLCEQVVGRGKVLALIDELAGAPITFAEYPASAEYILRLREQVNALIANGK